MSQDINAPIIKEQSVTKGCKEGIHDFMLDNAEMQMVDDKYVITTKCSQCGFIAVNASSSIGAMVGDYVEVAKNLPLPEPGEPVWAPGVKDRFNREKPNDEFWDSIKKGIK